MIIRYNKSRNLIEEHAYKPNLQDVHEPNLHRKIFTYGEIPKTAFNMRHVPMECPRDIFITDTTFRDGQQACKPFAVKDIVELFKMLHRLGGPNGLVRQSEFFLYSEKDREAVRKCMELGYEFPEITSWIRASEKDFELVKEFGIRETGILVSCSDYHIFKKMNLTRSQAMDKYLSVVKMALDRGIVPRCHFEDITRADYFGFVVPFAIELMKLSRESGIPIKIRACDTMGYGVTYPGTSLPRSVQGIIYGFRYYAEVPSEQLEWHGHNDFYKAVVNSATAWLYGCSSVNTTLLGIGERTGNTARGDGNRIRLPARQHGRNGPLRHHGDCGLLRARDGLRDSSAHAVRGQKLQCHQGGHTRRRAFEGPGNLQHFRHGKDSSPSREGVGGQLQRRCGHSVLAEQLLLPLRRGAD